MTRTHHQLSMALGLVLVLLVGMALVVPLSAQETPPTVDPNAVVTITGEVVIVNGVVQVNGFTLVGTLPLGLQAGDFVVVIGNQLADGLTIEVIIFDVVIPVTPEPEPTVEVTPELTPELTPEATPEATVEPEPEATLEAGCTNEYHPVAQSIADAFELPYAEIMNLHCGGYGFGEIARVYLLAEAAGLTVEELLDRREAGEGWGTIVRDTGVHPSDLAPGQLRRRGDDAESTPDPEATVEPGATLEPRGNGNGNGGGNGNGNAGGNGNGQDNGNGGGNENGQGNGNAGGNGQGNGRGNGGGNGNGRGNGRGG